MKHGAIAMLDRKVLRDSWHLRGQLFAASLVMACGIAILIMSQALFGTLRDTQKAYYDNYAFADVFAQVRRAPEALGQRIAAIPGVRTAETRIVGQARLDMPRLIEPATAFLVSLPGDCAPRLNHIRLALGRCLSPGKADEVVVSLEFAQAHGLSLGDTLEATIRGRKEVLRIVGLARSPEYIYVMMPGSFVPDRARLAVLFMNRDALETVYDLEGAFNDIVLKLVPGTDPRAVIAALDNLLNRYGGRGAYDRSDQPSHLFLDSELQQLSGMGRIIPPIFLGVAAIMLYGLLGRLFEAERQQIGLLKSFGLSNVTVGVHYMKMIVLPAVFAIAMGVGTGLFFADRMIDLYAAFFSFPFVVERFPFAAIAVGILTAFATAGAGALTAVWRAVRLPPAEAMRPPQPPAFRRSLLDRVIGAKWLSVADRIIIRNMVRRRLRSLMTVLGIAAGTATIIAMAFMEDSLDVLIDQTFFRTAREDVALTLFEPRNASVVFDAMHLPGIIAAEGARQVPVEARHGHLRERTALIGLDGTAELNRPIDAGGNPIRPPRQGLSVSAGLADSLGLAPGDRVRINVLEGRRPRLDLTVTQIAEDYFGRAFYMEAGALAAVLGEAPSVSEVRLKADPAEIEALYAAVKGAPAVASIRSRQNMLDGIRDTVEENILATTAIFLAFAAAVTAGVVYNAARIALSERGRELASLRVLGFSKLEVAYILLGELALLTLAALPLGAVLGYFYARLIINMVHVDIIRLPFVITSWTYGYAFALTLFFAVVAGALVNRRIRALDLIAVLKTRE